MEVAVKRGKYEGERKYIGNARDEYMGLGEELKGLIEGELDGERGGDFIREDDYDMGLNMGRILGGGDLGRNRFMNQG
nr:hypothetical protein [Staphylococcus aureus]